MRPGPPSFLHRDTGMGASLFDGMERRLVILDGGLGTTLETTCKIRIADTPLWSAEALSKEPEAIVAAHLAFLRAGAQIIETSTYQCSTNTFQRAGYSSDTARQLMYRAILLAQQARSTFHEEMRADNFQMEGIQRRSTAPHIRLCLSLGPFGASLSPTQEFGGFYPPPYGPRGYSTDGPNFNWSADAEAENEAIDALTTFHLERLLLFAQDSEIWSCIDIIAFETVPLAREAIAIRRTMARLREEHRDTDKQWWISFVFPDGRCPQMVDLNGTRLGVPDLVRAALSPSPFPLNSQLKGEKLPVPQGLGINCASVEFLPPIVAEMELACKEFVCEQWPFLVLYPNGGDEFDGSLGVWKPSDESAKSARVTKLVDLVDRILGAVDVKWSGIVVGGCCRCNAEQIDRLRNMLK